MLPLNANDHPFYMLASKEGTGKKAITKEGTQGLPLNFWKNGKLIQIAFQLQIAFQSIFNDHRERKTKNASKELNILNG